MNSIGTFLEVHDSYIREMDHAYKSLETSGVRKYFHSGYHGYFGTRQLEKAEYFDMQDALEGIVQTGQALSDITTRFLHRHVRMPSEQYAVVFYEKAMEHAKGTAYAFMVEVWQEVGGSWQLIRETVEQA